MARSNWAVESTTHGFHACADCEYSARMAAAHARATGSREGSYTVTNDSTGQPEHGASVVRLDITGPIISI